MGLLDQLASQALSSFLGGGQQGAAGNNQSALIQIAMSLLNSHGGLEGLLGKLNAGGLGQQTASWVGTGDNQAIDPSQISSALGHGTITDLAKQFGLSNDAVAGGLAQLLPQMINHATPQGSTQGGNELLSQGLGALLQMMNKQ